MSYKQLTKNNDNTSGLEESRLQRTDIAKEVGVHNPPSPANCAAIQDSAAIAPSKPTACHHRSKPSRTTRMLL
jgi:hypothetical protein